jgi:hypothetical protein
VLFAEVVVLGIQLRHRRPRHAERIETGDHVSAHAVRAHQLIEPILQDGDRRLAVAGVGNARHAEQARGAERGREPRVLRERPILAREPLEIGAPVGLHRRRIAQEVGVESLEEACAE